MAQHAHEQSDRYIGNPENWIKHPPPLARHAAIWLTAPRLNYMHANRMGATGGRSSRPRSQDAKSRPGDWRSDLFARMSGLELGAEMLPYFRRVKIKQGAAGLKMRGEDPPDRIGRREG
jgi:hypothetical protein